MKKLMRSLLSVTLVATLCLSSAGAIALDDARWLLDTFYIEEIPDEVLSQDSLDAILRSIGDPYTVYYTPERYEAVMADAETEYVGIGVTIPVLSDINGVLVLEVKKGSPADQAGIKAGDYITAINGVVIEPDCSTEHMLSGTEGSKVTLAVRDSETGRVYTKDLVRTLLDNPIVSYEQVGGVPFIRMASFDQPGLEDSVRQILQQHDTNKAWVLDLRNNPGGITNVAANAVSWFTGGEQPIVYFRDRTGTYTAIHSEYNTDLTDQPLIIMTNDQSASASELFAAAIRDNQAGIAIGGRTYGKGIAQGIFSADIYPEIFTEGDALKVTIFRFYSPNGVNNHVVGVLPTLNISPINVEDVAVLLAHNTPPQAEGFLKLELANQTFFISDDLASSLQYTIAFDELLEALPPSAALYQGGKNNTWKAITPQQAAAAFGLSYDSRGFSDTADSFAGDAINTLAVQDLISGYSDGTFRPGETITRAEFCAMLANVLRLPLGNDHPAFTDIPATAWYANAVRAVYNAKLISGDGNGAFRPDDTMTGEELVAILANVADLLTVRGHQLVTGHWSESALNTYDEYSDWARSSAATLNALGALDLQQPPHQQATRATTVQLLHSFMHSTGLLWE